MTTPELLANPYVGPRTFETADRSRFFGREAEAANLLGRVISERLLLFYAQSGAGKSSLINARLILALREEEGFTVLPVGRVAGALPAGVQQVDNIFLFNLMASLDRNAANPGLFAHLSLADFLNHLVTEDGVTWRYDPVAAVAPEDVSSSAAESEPAADASAGRFALIVDQFEEIITSHPDRWTERDEFFRQIDAVLQANPNLWVVLSLREDYVAALDPYAALVFNRLRARFYMERMGTAAALEAVCQPAAHAGRPFAPGVAEQLVDNLRQVRVPGQQITVPGQYVEPVQLQVVCFQLWENLTKGIGGNQVEAGPAISFEDLAQAGDVDQALTQFYEETLALALADPAAEGVSERQLRAWFDDELITDAGTRGLVHQGESMTGSLPTGVVRALQRRFLVRGEARGGDTWIELVHDRFVEPIRLSNQVWFGRNLNPLTLAAQAWQQAGRPEGKLYSGSQLAAAAAHMAANPADFGEVERAFVEAGQQVEMRRSARRQRVIAWGAVGLAALFLVLAGWALWSRAVARDSQQQAESARNDANQARMEAQQALSDQLAAQALVESQPYDLRLLLGVESAKLAKSGGGRSVVEATQSLATVLSGTLYSDLAIPIDAPIERIAVNSVDDVLIAVGGGKIVTVSLTDDAFLPGEYLYDGDFVELAFSRDKKLIAIASSVPITDRISRFELSVWNLENGESSRIDDVGRRPTSMVFAPDGSRLLVGTASGSVLTFMLPLEDVALELPYHTAEISVIDVSQDGSIQVTGGLDGVVLAEDIKERTPRGASIGKHSASITSVSISPDGQWIASGDAGGTVNLTHLVSDTQSLEVSTKLLTRYPNRVAHLAFSSNSSWLAVLDGGGIVQVWDMTSDVATRTQADQGEWVPFNTDWILRTQIPQTISQIDNYVNSISIDGTSHWLYATAVGKQEIFRWDLSAKDIAASGLVIPVPNPVSIIAVDGQQGQRLYVGTEDGLVRLMELDLDRLQHLACQTTTRNMTKAEWDQYFQGATYARTCNNLPAHPSIRESYIEVAKHLAEQGDLAEARFRLQQAVANGVEINEEEISQTLEQSLLESVRSLAKQGQRDQAFAIIDRAELSIDDNGFDRAKLEYVAEAWDLVNQIQTAARDGKIGWEQAYEQFHKAEDLDAELTDTFDTFIAPIFQQRTSGYSSRYIYGFHEPGGESLMREAGVPGWVLFKEPIGHDPNNRSSGDYSRWSSQGLGIIVNLVNGYQPDGTLPYSSQYENFAKRCGNFVAASSGAAIWVIGNEMNYWVERPGAHTRGATISGSGEVITPELYARAFSLCRRAIKSVPGHEDDEVLVGAVASWNNQTTYPENPNGDWVQYFSDVLTLLGPDGTDGFTIHTYTHSADPEQIDDDVKMGPPFQDRHYNFRAYQDFMNAVPESMRSLSVYITETNQDVTWLDENTGWVQRAYGEIDSWNSGPNNQKIRALLLYRWPNVPGDRWGIQGKQGVIHDFQDALRYGYRWTTTDLERQAIALAREGKVREASPLFRQVLNENPSLSFDPEARVGQIYASVLVEEAESLARQGEIDEAIALFEQANEYDPSMEIDPGARAGQLYALVLVYEAESLARQGEINEAVARFEQANGYDPSLEIDPGARAGQLYASVLVREAESLARQGAIDEAIVRFEQANGYDPSLEIDPGARAGQLYASVLVEEAESLARQGEIEEAVARFTQANEYDPTLEIDPEARAIELAPTPIAYGQVATGTVEAGQGENWLFDGSAGDTVTITQSDLDGSGLDTLLTLIGPDGEILIGNDDMDGSTDSQISAFVLPTDGLYVIQADGYGGSGGQYSLTLTLVEGSP